MLTLGQLPEASSELTGLSLAPHPVCFLTLTHQSTQGPWAYLTFHSFPPPQLEYTPRSLQAPSKSTILERGCGGLVPGNCPYYSSSLVIEPIENPMIAMGLLAPKVYKCTKTLLHLISEDS